MPEPDDMHTRVSIAELEIEHLKNGHARQDAGQAEMRADIKELGKGQSELGHQVKELGMELKFDLETTKHQIEEKLSSKLDEMASSHTKQMTDMACEHTAQISALATDVTDLKVDLKVFFSKLAGAGAVVLLLIQYAPDLIPFL